MNRRQKKKIDKRITQSDLYGACRADYRGIREWRRYSHEKLTRECMEVGLYSDKTRFKTITKECIKTGIGEKRKREHERSN